jgi:hypothetical protein
MGLIGTTHAVAEVAELRARTAQVREALEEKLRNEGGEVLAVHALNSRLILNSPFPSKLIRVNTIGGRPVLLRIRVQYADDTGSWFVFAPSGMPMRWAWQSDAGNSELPVERDEAARVCNDVWVVPLWASALLYITLVAAVMFVVVHFGGKR